MTEPDDTNELSTARKTIDSVIVHYVNAGFAAGLLTPDWNRFRQSEFYKATAKNFTQQIVEQQISAAIENLERLGVKLGDLDLPPQLFGKNLTWWWIYPLRGLTFSEPEKMSLDEPILPDLTIISNFALRSLAQNTHANNQQNIQTIFRSSGFDSFPYYVAVKRGSTDKPEQELEDQARAEKRADEFLALLMFYTFSESSQAACGFAKRANWQSFDWIAYEKGEDRWSINLATRQPIFYVEQSPLIFSSSTLLNTLRTSRMGSTVDLILSERKGHYHESVRSRFSSAVRVLAHGFYVNQPAELLTAIVTMIEILLKQNQDKDEVIKRRLTSLLKIDMRTIEADLYSLRNLWVHQGAFVSVDQCRSSIGLALSLLVVFADYMKGCPPQTVWSDFIAWVDLQAHVAHNTRPKQLKRLWKHFDSINEINKPE